MQLSHPTREPFVLILLTPAPLEMTTHTHTLSDSVCVTRGARAESGALEDEKPSREGGRRRERVSERQKKREGG